MMISIIIPTHHRSKSLEYLLESLKSDLQHISANLFEVILVVDGYDRDTVELLNSFQRTFPLKYFLHDIAQGAAEARNAGVEQANGSVFAFLDDDVVVRAGWFSELQNVLCQKEIDVWSGAVRYMNDFYRGVYPDRIVQNHDGAFPLGAHLIVRRESFVPFETEFSDLHNEDTAFVLQCLERGAKFAPAPNLVVYHLMSWWESPSAVISAAKHMQALPPLMKRYPMHFSLLPIERFGIVFFPRELLTLLFLPTLIIPLFLRFCYVHRLRLGKALPYFLAKWPCSLIARRVHLWKSAWKNKVFVV